MRSDVDVRLQAAHTKTRAALLAERTASLHWQGELSASALSTATAVATLAIAARHTLTADARSTGLIADGLSWLAQHQNVDGGWGDTTRSLSNISTTALGWAAFGATPGADASFQGTVAAAEAWLTSKAGGVAPHQIAPTIIARYGKDRTFSVPILTMCALAGRLGQGREAWEHVLPLPFELAALPHQFFATIQLPVVSYALPALIAIGQARHFHRPSRNPFTRAARVLTKARTLKILRKIQPSSGGFLEATPLTSFVTMSLAGSGQIDHPVAQLGLKFLRESVRLDGSWPIDTNLATWVTTLSLNALGAGCSAVLSPDERACIRHWLLAQQYRTEHPYTHAEPGGWAWTDLPGGVPDADDTAGALMALHNLGDSNDSVRAAAVAGVEWLLNLQNRDGGIPTFCRGWGALPFDRSGADLTAHAIRAWLAWLNDLPTKQQARTEQAIARALRYLAAKQSADGSWLPLWFGNQFARDDENPVYGTARVIEALVDAVARGQESARPLLERGTRWLTGAQNAEGSWGMDGQGWGTIEETALSLGALAAVRPAGDIKESALADAIERGTDWLIAQVENDGFRRPSPIGFYFAKLWYFERLYPLIFTVGALEQLRAEDRTHH